MRQQEIKEEVQMKGWERGNKGNELNKCYAEERSGGEGEQKAVRYLHPVQPATFRID